MKKIVLGVLGGRRPERPGRRSAAIVVGAGYGSGVRVILVHPATFHFKLQCTENSNQLQLFLNTVIEGREVCEIVSPILVKFLICTRTFSY